MAMKSWLCRSNVFLLNNPRIYFMSDHPSLHSAPHKISSKSFNVLCLIYYSLLTVTFITVVEAFLPLVHAALST